MSKAERGMKIRVSSARCQGRERTATGTSVGFHCILHTSGVWGSSAGWSPSQTPLWYPHCGSGEIPARRQFHQEDVGHGTFPAFSHPCALWRMDIQMFSCFYLKQAKVSLVPSLPSKKMLIFSSIANTFFFPTLAPWPGRCCKEKVPWSCTALGSI